MNAQVAVAQPVVEDRWEPLLAVPKDDAALLTTFMPLLALLLVYGTSLFFALAGRMP